MSGSTQVSPALSPALNALARAPIRKSSIGNGRAPKKGGAGGKGTWGVPGDEFVPTDMNRDDPNFDPAEIEDFALEPVVPRLVGAEFKQEVDACLDSYVAATSTMKEAVARLSELNSPLYRHYIVSKLLRLALPDQLTRAIELLSFLSSAAVSFLTSDQLLRGLDSAFALSDEWELDSPGIRTGLHNVVAALEESDRLPASYLSTRKALRSRLPEHKTLLRDQLREFFVSYDAKELCGYVHSLNCPPFHPHVVKNLLRSALEQSPREREQAALALSLLTDGTGPVSDLQCSLGVELLLAESEDLLLDNPDGKKALAEMVARAVVDECLTPSFLEHVFLVKPGDAGHEIVTMAKQLLSEPGAASKLRSIWVSSPLDPEC